MAFDRGFPHRQDVRLMLKAKEEISQNIVILYNLPALFVAVCEQNLHH